MPSKTLLFISLILIGCAGPQKRLCYSLDEAVKKSDYTLAIDATLEFMKSEGNPKDIKARKEILLKGFKKCGYELNLAEGDYER
jgi:hypothetical protein